MCLIDFYVLQSIYPREGSKVFCHIAIIHQDCWVLCWAACARNDAAAANNF